MTWQWLGAVLLFGGIFWVLWRRRDLPDSHEKDAGTFADHFIHVNEDGTARELTSDEREYLNTKFHPADSGRPYIKASYSRKAPDGRIDGFLLRKRLPRRVRIVKP